MTRLNPMQKRVICEIAKEAYDLLPERDVLEVESAGRKNAFDAWRHEEQFKAVGVRSLALCTDDHYRPLMRHFQNLRQAAADARGQHSLSLT